MRAAVDKLRPAGTRGKGAPEAPPHAAPRTPRAGTGPRSSNLALAKSFTDRDKDEFLHQAFEYTASFFENSLTELAARNPGIEGSFRRVDANRFFSTIYRDGKAISRCTIFMGGMFGRGINFSSTETTDSNSCNVSVTVDADHQSCFLRSMMMFGAEAKQKLTFEGAAELLWDMLIQPLQYR